MPKKKKKKREERKSRLTGSLEAVLELVAVGDIEKVVGAVNGRR